MIPLFDSTPVDGITAHLMGGLGNQLFIFGAGSALAKSLNCEVFFDVSWFNTQNRRQFELGFLSSCPKLLHSPAEAPSVLGRLLARCGVPVSQTKLFREKSFAYDPNIWNVVPGMSIYGYFQSWKYLEPIAQEVQHMILNSTPNSEWFQSQQQYLKNLGSWTSMHIRRGDYMNPKTREFHGLVERGYYERAVRVVDELMGPQPVVVFSDDAAAARRELTGIRPEMHFLETPVQEPPHQALLLMASAPASIIANSSFSWWGAWLTDHPQKVVVAPRPWFDDPASNERDLFPPHWISLGR